MLFSYLYSDFAFALIEAETTENRSTIENPTSNNHNFKLYSLTKEDFIASSIYQSQKKALQKIQDIYNKYNTNSPFLDILNIRFTCLPLNFCQLTINNDIFIDPYSFAKEHENSSLSNNIPLIYINSKNKDNTNAIHDHFRYMWLHPTTLFYEDATHAEFNHNSKNPLDGLYKIKEPNDILFEKKTQKINIYKDTFSEEEINRWKFKVERMFCGMTRTIEVSTDTEVLFIGFSFKKGKTVAEDLCKYIKEDFQNIITINIVDVWNKGKNPLYQELMKNMNEATIGLILFTKDIEENTDTGIQHYSRPNLYFEYGYLLKQVEKYGSPLRRIMIMAENNSVIPTDMQDMPREDLNKNIHITYKPIIKRLLEVTQTLTQAKAERAVNSYIQRIQDMYSINAITNNDLKGKSLQEYCVNIKNELNSKIHERFIQKK